MKAKRNLTESEYRIICSMSADVEFSYDVLITFFIISGISRERAISVLLIAVADSLIIPDFNSKKTLYKINPFYVLIKKAQEAKHEA